MALKARLEYRQNKAAQGEPGLNFKKQVKSLQLTASPDVNRASNRKANPGFLKNGWLYLNETNEISEKV